MIKEVQSGTCLEYQNLVHSIPANVRLMRSRDCREIATIGYGRFEYPWLKRTRPRRNDIVCYVVEHDGFVAAYAVIQYCRDHFELCNLVVDQPYRRHKIATLLIDMLKIKAHLEGISFISACVGVFNLPAQSLLMKNGFMPKELLHNYATGCNAHYMECPTEQI